MREFVVEFNDEEFNQINDAAIASNQSFAGYVRQAALNVSKSKAIINIKTSVAAALPETVIEGTLTDLGLTSQGKKSK